VRRAGAYLALRFPALTDQPVIETRVCQLENTADEHFIIDRHPDYDKVVIAGGGSGHGFKHGPVIGEYIAKRALGRAHRCGVRSDGAVAEELNEGRLFLRCYLLRPCDFGATTDVDGIDARPPHSCRSRRSCRSARCPPRATPPSSGPMITASPLV